MQLLKIGLKRVLLPLSRPRLPETNILDNISSFTKDWSSSGTNISESISSLMKVDSFSRVYIDDISKGNSPFPGVG